MGLDLLGLCRKLFGRTQVRLSVAIGIDVVNRDVRVGNRRLFQILVDTTPTALIAAFQLDRHTRSALQMLQLVFRFGVRRRRIVGDPFDAAIRDRLMSFLACRNLFALSAPVDDLRHVPLRID
jgi:hypothetical protein